MGYEGVRVSSRKLKVLTGADRLTKMTWHRVIHQVISEKYQAPKKEHMGDGTFRESTQAPKKESIGDEHFRWQLIGSSLEKVSAESFGFTLA